MTYEVRHNNRVLTQTGWKPMAEAAWHRATRDQAAGGVVELIKEGRVVAVHRIVGGRGAAWPDGQASQLQDLVKAIFQYLRGGDWEAKSIAEAMTSYGLPTSPIKGLGSLACQRITPG